jgi:tetratricopeptide (TPR) repeat protein
MEVRSIKYVKDHLRSIQLIILFFAFNWITAGDRDDLFDHARNLYYESVENRKKVEQAIDLFEEIGKDSSYYATAKVYIGSLHALKGKHAFFPLNKYKHVLIGLDLMDEGILHSPNNIEALFIRGSTCYYLPFFFKRKKQAIQDFRKIISLLDHHYQKYESQVMVNVLNFIKEKIELNNLEMDNINRIEQLLEAE